MKKLGILAIHCMAVLFLTSCWSRVEVNDIAIVTATAIDRMNDGKIRLAVQVAIPKQLGPVGAGGTGGETETTILVSETGKTIMDVSRKLQEKLSRRVFFSHSRNLIIGEKAARAGVFPLLDFFSRGREARLRGYILFSKGEAADLLKTNPTLERYTSEVIREEEKMGVGLEIMQKDFIDMLTTEGISPVAAQVAMKPEAVNGDHSTMTPAIVGTAVFRKDKLIGWMNDKETRGVLWLRDEMKEANLTVTVPKEKGGGDISVKLLKATTKIKPVLQQGKAKMNVHARTEVELFENGSTLDLGDPKVLRYIQTLLEADVKERILLALHKAQKEFNSDIFGFGNAIYRTDPKAWKKQFKDQWYDQFPKLEVSVQPEVSIVRTGLSTKSPEIKD